MSSISDPKELDKRLVRYADLIPCTTAFIDTRTPGSKQKENFTIIGPGVAENPNQHVHITEPHGFNIGGARQPPGCVNSQHSHNTVEVFIVHSGTWAFRTGETATDGEVILRAGDIISIPTNCFRGFENIGEGEGFLFAVLGGDDAGHVLWAPDVFRQAEQYGLKLLESGRLIDTSVGETVPDDEQPQVSPTPEMLERLDQFDSSQLKSRVVSRKVFDALGFVEFSEGVRALSLIGDSVTDIGVDLPNGELSGEHGFNVLFFHLQSGSAGSSGVRHNPEVVFVQKGEINIRVDGVEISMGAGDVFTVPVGSERSYSNQSDSEAEIYLVLGKS